MDFSKADDIRIGSVPVQSAWLGGRKVWDRTERKIMRSMVCWYDIARQGCTNEAMAQNPVLKDLSGNGNDMTCYNFAWGGMSGIGGYASDFNRWVKNTENVDFTATDSRIRISGFITGVLSSFISIASRMDAYQINVVGLTDDIRIYYKVTREDDTQPTVLLKNGINDLPESFGYTSFIEQSGYIGTCDITIEILPDYPGALVSDGVDDYCFVEGLPILTDYTVIARRFYSGFEQTGNVNASLASKREASSSEDGAFQFERFSGENIKTFNFGASLDIKEAIDGSPSVSWQTASSYNGDALAKGGAADTQSLSLFRLRKGSTVNALKAALYSLILFDRTLTDAEIDWVKANLVAPPGEDYLRLKDGILLKDGSPLLLKDGSPLALKRIENTD